MNAKQTKPAAKKTKSADPLVVKAKRKPKADKVKPEAEPTPTIDAVDETPVAEAPLPVLVVVPEPVEQPQGEATAEESNIELYHSLVEQVRVGIVYFIESGQALARLRDTKCYKAGGYATFEACALQLFGYSRAQAYRLIDASVVAAQIWNDVKVLVPNERTARAFFPIKNPEDRAAVAVLAKEMADKVEAKAINSSFIETAAREVLGDKKESQVTPRPKPIDQLTLEEELADPRTGAFSLVGDADLDPASPDALRQAQLVNELGRNILRNPHVKTAMKRLGVNSDDNSLRPVQQPDGTIFTDCRLVALLYVALCNASGRNR